MSFLNYFFLLLCMICIIYFKLLTNNFFSNNILYSNSTKDYKKYDWVGITSSSDDHFKVSLNLILSFFITHPNDFLIYYDMELSKSNKILLNENERLLNQYLLCNKHKGKLLIKIFNFSLYPNHFSIGNYTWKQVMIYNTLMEYKKLIFWFDAGVELNTSVEKEIEIAKKYDFYMPHNEEKILNWTPVKTSNSLHVNRDLLKGKSDGDIGYLAINYNDYMMNNIIKKWVECAYNPMCICPPGASRANSRYDQVTFTMLLYLDEKYKNIVGTFETYKNHKQQCDHRRDCYIEQKYITIKNNIKYC